MSNKSFDKISDLKPGRYDYKIKCRIIRKWRGCTRTGEEFKAFNVLLIDNMKTRIHAFIPGFCVDNLEDQIELDKVYTIKNFTVQNYKEADIYRCLRNEKQLIFSKDTKFEEVEDKQSNIPSKMFDLYEHSELRSLAGQKTYLTDVVGIMTKYEFRDLKKEQVNTHKQAKFTMSDGSSNLKATFWDNFALKINEAVLQATEKPIIIIISSGKVGLWNDEVEISNVSATRFYLNYKHHSVFQLRRKLAEPNFAKKIMKEQPKKIRELLTLEKITQLGKDYIETEVFTHVNIKNVDDTTIWFINACTTCGRNTELSNGLMVCANCPRTVPHPDKKYKINVAASDPTGGVDIILCDREIRTLIGKRARDVHDETKKNKFPQILKEIAKKDYTVGIRIREINVVDHYQVYLATNICNGFVKPSQQTFETLNETSTSQATTSTYNLQGISDLNFQSN